MLGKRKGIIRSCLFGIAAALAVVWGVTALREDYKNKKEYEDLQQYVNSGRPTEPPLMVLIEDAPKPDLESYASPVDFPALAAINPDVVGWITIPGTTVDYPIVQASDNDAYLRVSFQGQPSRAGSIFLDYASKPDFSGYNSVIYGHNLLNGSMFEPFVQYKQEDFFKEHREIILYTPEKTINLLVVAAYGGVSDAEKRRTEFKSDEKFLEYFEKMIAPCAYKDVPEWEIKRVYTLITCSYETDDYRTYLFAVEIPEE